jgi:hypothetical protein
MRLGIKHQLLLVCVLSSLAAGAAGYLGYRAASDVRERGEVMHGYSDGMHDLALAGQGLSSFAFSVRQAHTPGIGTAADQAACDRAETEVDARLAAFAARRLASGGEAPGAADLAAFTRSWETVKRLELLLV